MKIKLTGRDVKPDVLMLGDNWIERNCMLWNKMRSRFWVQEVFPVSD